MLIQKSKDNLTIILKALSYVIVSDDTDSMLLRSKIKTYLLLANPILKTWTVCDKGVKIISFELKDDYEKEEIQKHFIDVK